MYICIHMHAIMTYHLIDRLVDMCLLFVEGCQLLYIALHVSLASSEVTVMEGNRYVDMYVYETLNVTRINVCIYI